MVQMLSTLSDNQDMIGGGNSYRSQRSFRKMFRLSKKRILPNRDQCKSIETLSSASDEIGDHSLSSCRSHKTAQHLESVEKEVCETPDSIETDSEAVKATSTTSCLKISTQDQSIREEWKRNTFSMDINETDDESKSSLDWPFASRTPSVHFDSISVHMHIVTLGDNPAVSIGPPIGIEWNAMETFTLSVNEYEETKPLPRDRHEMLIPVCVRETMLRDVGFGRFDIVSATKAAKQIQKNRRKSEKDGVLATAIKHMFRPVVGDSLLNTSTN